jgi:hypothetical protein
MSLGGNKQPARKADNLTAICESSGNFYVSHPCGPSRPGTGATAIFTYFKPSRATSVAIPWVCFVNRRMARLYFCIDIHVWRLPQVVMWSARQNSCPSTDLEHSWHSYVVGIVLKFVYLIHTRFLFVRLTSSWFFFFAMALPAHSGPWASYIQFRNHFIHRRWDSIGEWSVRPKAST